WEANGGLMIKQEFLAGECRPVEVFQGLAPRRGPGFGILAGRRGLFEEGHQAITLGTGSVARQGSQKEPIDDLDVAPARGHLPGQDAGRGSQLLVDRRAVGQMECLADRWYRRSLARACADRWRLTDRLQPRVVD